jgi:hypothetical protein
VEWRHDTDRLRGTDEAGEWCRRGVGHRRVARSSLRCWARQGDQRAQSKLVAKPLDQSLGLSWACFGRSGRLSWRLSAQGWAGHPSRSRRLLSLCSFSPVPARNRIDAATRWASWNCSLHIARYFEKTRCPWFLSPSSMALAGALFPSGQVGRFFCSPSLCSSRKVGLSDG